MRRRPDTALAILRLGAGVRSGLPCGPADLKDRNQDTSAPGKHNDQATYVFQPLIFNGTKIALPAYQVSWKLDVGAGTWMTK